MTDSYMPIILFISTDVFSNGLFTTDAIAAVQQSSHSLTLSLGLSASLLSLPLYLCLIQKPWQPFPADQLNKDSELYACSHFYGIINTKSLPSERFL